MDADDLIDRNRALMAMAEQTRCGSRRAVGMARELLGIARAVSDRASQINAQSGVIRPATGQCGGADDRFPGNVQRLQAEATDLHARVRALLATAKLPR
jgi:hypothetical protein